MRTLVITDLHLNAKVDGLLDAQVDAVLKIYSKESPDEVIIMGDVFMHRRPTPSALLGFRKIIEGMDKLSDVVVLRGNHDSETKADDGVTALSLYHKPGVRIVTHTYTDEAKKRVYIPHYEHEETIISALEMVPKGFTVFGHFGYAGCLNSVGDADFGISLSHFTSDTFLGHIHGFCEGRGGLQKPHSKVVCLGTPYTTNYGEAFKDNFYAILDDGVEFKQPTSGPRHLIYPALEVEAALDIINDPNYFTFLRVMVEADHHPIPYDKLKVAYLDIKYSPVFNEEELSSFSPSKDLFSINEGIIKEYVESANSVLSTESLMEGYSLLKDED